MAEQSTEFPIVSGYDVRHGWLSPEGTLYSVEYEGHEDFCDAKGVSQNSLYAKGWVKLSGGEWYGDQWDSRNIGVSQRQYDYIYGWYESRKIAFPTEEFSVR